MRWKLLFLSELVDRGKEELKLFPLLGRSIENKKKIKKKSRLCTTYGHHVGYQVDESLKPLGEILVLIVQNFFPGSCQILCKLQFHQLEGF